MCPTLTPAKLITTKVELINMVDHLRQEPLVAVDTESNSLYAYREQVCLIQFSIPSADYLVDPLALLDISVLGGLFASPKTEKVFHAAEYDLLTLKRDFNFTFTNLFDTMVAARILGRPRVGLGNLLEEEFGVILDKKYQRANWGKRPLSRQMLDYARLDTHYLIRLRGLLSRQLQSSGHMPLAKEDFARLCQVNGSPPEPQEVDVWRINGVRDLTPQQVTILRYLAEYRQTRARALDRPLFKVISDKALVAIAQTEPQSLNELGHLHGMTGRQLRWHGQSLLDAVRRGAQDKPTHRPSSPQVDERTILLLEELKEWRKHTARSMGVESDVVLPRDIMEQIAWRKPASQDALAEIMADVPWRLEKYGGRLLAIVEKA